MTEFSKENRPVDLSLEEKKLQFEKYKFNLGLVKWLIGSVALVVVTIIIDNGFRERTAGLEEMQAYDEYVEVILRADNIEERWKLANYFATVTPSERLRERWLVYRDSIEEDYRTFKKLKKEREELEEKQELLVERQDTSLERLNVEKQLRQVQNEMKPYDKQLLTVDHTLSAGKNDYDLAIYWEDKGFSFLMERDVTNAIRAFENSEDAYPQFHQVYEIAKYLTANRKRLLDPKSKAWKEVLLKITNDYSWRMPVTTKRQLTDEVAR